FLAHLVVERNLVSANRTPIGRIENQYDRSATEVREGERFARFRVQCEGWRLCTRGKNRVSGGVAEVVDRHAGFSRNNRASIISAEHTQRYSTSSDESTLGGANNAASNRDPDTECPCNQQDWQYQ